MILGLITFLFKDAGFRGGIQVYAAVTLITGIATWLFVPYDDEAKVDMGEDKIDFRVIGKVMKMPVAWYLGAFTWGYFMVRSTVPYPVSYTHLVTISHRTDLLWHTFKGVCF